MRTRNVILIGLVLLLTAVPLWLKGSAGFGGTDDRAEQAITQVHPGYKPWFRSLWEPPGSEVESLLFAVQAAAGAGFIGYFLGYSRGRRETTEKTGESAARTDGIKGC